jgi:hypothetical protein
MRLIYLESYKARTGPAGSFQPCYWIDSLASYTLYTAIMPSDLSYWIISAPLKDGDPGIMLMDVRNAVGDNVEVGQWEVPELKVGHSLRGREEQRAEHACPDMSPLVSRVCL